MDSINTLWQQQFDLLTSHMRTLTDADREYVFNLEKRTGNRLRSLTFWVWVYAAIQTVVTAALILYVSSL